MTPGPHNWYRLKGFTALNASRHVFIRAMTGWIKKILKRKESHTALLQHSGNRFNVPRNTTLLQAALDQNIAFPHQCTVGTCGTCRCRLIEGKIKPILDFSYTLTRKQLAAGYILACQSLLKSDVVVDLRKRDVSTEPDSLKAGLQNVS